MYATPEGTSDGSASGANGAGTLGPVKDGASATVGRGTPLGPGYGGPNVTANSQVTDCRRDLSKFFDQDTTRCTMNGDGRDRGNLDAKSKIDINESLNKLNFGEELLDADDENDLTMTETDKEPTANESVLEDLETTGKTMDRTWIGDKETETKKKRQTCAEIWEKMKDNEGEWTDILSREAKRKMTENRTQELNNDDINTDDFDIFKGSKRSIGYERRMRLKKAKTSREMEVRAEDPLQQEVIDTYLSKESFSDIVRKKERYMFEVKVRSTYAMEEAKLTQAQLDELDLQLLGAYMEHIQQFGDNFEYDAVAGYSKETGVGWLSAGTKDMAEFIINVAKTLKPPEQDDEVDPLEYYIYLAEDRVYRNMWTSVHGKWTNYTLEQLTMRIKVCNPILKYKEDGVTRFYHFKVHEIGPLNSAGFFKIGLQVDERIINKLKNPAINGKLKLGFSDLLLHGSNVEQEVKAAIRQRIVDEIETVRTGFKAIALAPGNSRH